MNVISFDISRDERDITLLLLEWLLRSKNVQNERRGQRDQGKFMIRMERERERERERTKTR